MKRSVLVIFTLILSGVTSFSLYGQAPVRARKLLRGAPERRVPLRWSMLPGGPPPFTGTRLQRTPYSGTTRPRFLDAPEYATDQFPAGLAAGDFNKDGKLDVVTVCGGCAQGADGVDVILGNGDGSFQAPVAYASGGIATEWVTVDDFNSDGNLDLAVVNYCSSAQSCLLWFPQGSVSILFGNGDGTFQPPVSYIVGYEPNFVAAGRLNGDTSPDLVVTNKCGEDSQCASAPTISVLLNRGDGTFGMRSDYSVGWKAQGVAIADLNHDGKADLAVAAECGNDSTCQSNGTVSIFLGNGNGTFQSRADYNAGTGRLFVAVGDFNRDGTSDLALPSGCVRNVTCEHDSNGSQNDQGVVSILLGNGDGTFQNHVDYYAGIASSCIAIGDLNGNGKLDLAVTNLGSLSVLLGRGDGTFATHVDYGAGYFPCEGVIGDVNGDGKQDIVVLDRDSTGFANAISVLINNGNGTFRSRLDNVAGKELTAEAVGDLNGDGKLDIVTADAWNSTVAVLLGASNHTYQFLGEASTKGFLPFGVALADFNRDGKLDVATVNFCPTINCNLRGTVAVLLGNGNGTLQPAVTYQTGYAPFAVAAGDLNRDNIPDLVIANIADSTVSVLIGNGDGTFQPQVQYPTGSGPSSVVAADFNRDGKVDIAVTNYYDGTIGILLGNGDGTLQPHRDYATGGFPNGLSIADFNRDGILDLAVSSCGTSGCQNETGSVSVSLGKGDGSFPQHADYPVGCQPQWAAVGDFTGRNQFGAVTVNPMCNTASVLLGNGDGTLQPYVDYRVGDTPLYAAVAGSDIVVANEFGNTVSVLPNLGVTLTTLTSSPNPSKAGQQVTFTAKVVPNIQGGQGTPTGKVTFKSGSSKMTVNLVNGVAKFTTSQLKPGTYKFTASYPGDGFFNPSTSMTITQVVNP